MHYLDDIYKKIEDLELNDDCDMFYYKGLVLSLNEHFDYDSIISNYQKGITCGSSLCKYGLAVIYLKQGDKMSANLLFSSAFSDIEEKSKKGESECLRMMSSYYLKGYGNITPNIIKAFQYLKLSAERNNVLSMYNLAYCYYKGEGTLRDLNLAQLWCLKCDAVGYKKAAVLLELINNGE